MTVLVYHTQGPEIQGRGEEEGEEWGGRGERGEDRRDQRGRGGRGDFSEHSFLFLFFTFLNQCWTHAGNVAVCSLWEILETRVFQISVLFCISHVRTFA